MTVYAAKLAYDGSAYFGFQRQPEPTPTIQRELEKAIERVTGQPVTVVAAGRTDTGVHAWGQVVAFDAEWKHNEEELQSAINALLPNDMALRTLRAREGFHPRYDAIWRQYVYRIMTPGVRNPLLPRQVWPLVGQELDIAAMQEAAVLCLGEHDFAAFGRPPQEGSSNTVREIFLSRWEIVPGEFGDVYTYRVRGTAFLYHMVRRLVGSMAQAGTGKITVLEFARVLASRDLQRAKLLAPAQGLVLEAVGYPPGAETTVNAGQPALALAGA